VYKITKVGLIGIKYKNIYLLAISFLLLLASPVFASPQNLNRFYKEINLINGIGNKINFYIHKKSLNLDISRTSRIRFLLELNSYFQLIGRKDTFAIKVYDLSYGKRELINYSRVKIHGPRTKYKLFNVDLLNFKNTTRDLEIELLDHNDNLINTYAETISPVGLETSDDTIQEKIISSECTADEFGECHLDYLMQHIHFESRIRKDLSTEVIKKEDGSYLVSIPNIRLKNKVKTIRYRNVIGNSTRLNSKAIGRTLQNISNEIKFINSDYEISSLDSVLILDSSKKPITLLLPNPEINIGLKIVFKRKNPGYNEVKISASNYLIDGKNEYKLTEAYESISIISTGSEWLIL